MGSTFVRLWNAIGLVAPHDKSAECRAPSALAAMIFGLHVIASAAQEPERIHTVAFFPSASDAFRAGLARVINHSGEAGEVRMDVFDDEGESYGPVVLALDAGAAVHFTSDDLESGNAAKGLPGAIGPGEGDWRLELSSELDIEVLSYVRTGDGFLTAMHDTAPSEGGRHRIAFFNPASNASQVSRLRLVNPSEEAAEVSIVGVDDRGESPGSEVTTTIAAGASRTFTAAELESGGEELQGALGDGEGKWRLTVASAQPLVAMSLLSDPTGHLTNLSTAPGRESQGAPDLVVVSPSVSNRRPVAGATFTLSATVRNDGDAPSPVTVLRYYRSTNATMTTTDRAVGTDAVAGLAASGSASASVVLTAPSTPATYYYGACVEAVAEEFDTANNCSTSVEVNVRESEPEPQGSPDLVVASPKVSDNAPAAGATFTLSVTVSNAGDGASPSAMTRYYRSPDATITTTDRAVDTDAVAGLAASGSASESVELSAPSTPGTHYYGACVDAVAGESDTTNNCSKSVPIKVPEREPQPQGRPELSIPAVSVATSPGGTYTDDAFTLSATVRNTGDGESAATTLRYYRSSDATITTSDTEVGTDEVAGLGASASGSESVELSAPSTPGTYYYGACVAAVAEESDTTNNCSTSRQVEVLDPHRPPDLVVGSPTVSDDGPVAGEAFTLSATVSNAGDGDSAATTLRYYRSADSTITTSDMEVGTDAVAGLAASASSDESVELTAPSTPGPYYYMACVDAVAQESDTTNNCSTSVRVTVPYVRTHPDLVVDAPSVDDSTPEVGVTFTLSATVRNQGDGGGAATTLRYYRSADASISTADTEVGTDRVDWLHPVWSSDESVTLSAPTDPGDHYYGACVDPVAGESDISNNCSSSVRVTAPQHPDLVVDTPTVSESTPDAGESFRLSATVRNRGGEHSAYSWLRYYRSADPAITTADAEVGAVILDGGVAASASREEWVWSRAPSDPGTYYYGACVDAVPDESDTANNCSSSVRVTVPAPTTFPDLVVDTPIVSESAPDAGAPFTLSATVRNRGDADAEATTLRYYRSTDATVTTEDTLVGTDAVGGLAASGAGTESARLSAPSDAGAYYYGACVDAVDGESDATNNCSAAVRVTVPEPAGDPDLVVDAPPLGDGNAGGGEFTLSATVRNRGGRAAAATSLVYYRSRDARISPDDLEMFTAEVPGLAALGTSAYSELVRVPWDPGAHYFGACVKAVPGESDTTNNCSAAIVLLQPDLVADSVSARRTLKKREEFGLYAAVRNLGTAAAPSTRLRYYHSSDGAISTSDNEVATIAVPRLEVPGMATIGQGSTMGRLVTVTAPSDPGIHYYGACVDAVPGESDTTDNCSEGYRVQVFGEPDLVVREPSVSESNLEPGMEFTLSVTVRNQGDADSLSQPTLRFYRSVGTRISTTDIEVGTSWVGVLRVSASHDRSLTLNAPSDPGNYYFYGACVDAVSNESNTRNNCSSAVRVTVSDP